MNDVPLLLESPLASVRVKSRRYSVVVDDFQCTIALNRHLRHHDLVNRFFRRSGGQQRQNAGVLTLSQPLQQNFLTVREPDSISVPSRFGAHLNENHLFFGADTELLLQTLEDVCRKYACACTVKTATKPVQPIEKSTAGASLLAQVIVGKCADHLPLHRQEKIFERHGVNLSRETMGGWLAQCADLLNPLYGSLKQALFQSKVIGTDDNSVKVLDIKLPFARTGRVWPYYGDKNHPVIVYERRRGSEPD